jgi:hypothetical protein
MADLPELTVRVGVVERDLTREIVKREGSDKYTHNMMEDIQARYSDIAISFGKIEATFTQHLVDDKRMASSIDRMDTRMRTIERLAWIAVGGVVVIAALFSVFGSMLVRLWK